MAQGSYENNIPDRNYYGMSIAFLVGKYIS